MDIGKIANQLRIKIPVFDIFSLEIHIYWVWTTPSISSADYSIEDAIKVTIERLQKVLPIVDVFFVNLVRKSIRILVVKVIVTDNILRLNSSLLSVSYRLYSFSKHKEFSEKLLKYEELYLGN